MRVVRYRYRGAQIATPWNWNQVNPTAPGHRRMAFDETEFLGWVQERLFG